MFDLPSHVRPSERITVVVLAAASGGAVLRSAGAYPRELYGGVVALVLAANALLVWSLFHRESVRRQRALDPAYQGESRN